MSNYSKRRSNRYMASYLPPVDISLVCRLGVPERFSLLDFSDNFAKLILRSILLLFFDFSCRVKLFLRSSVNSRSVLGALVKTLLIKLARVVQIEKEKTQSCEWNCTGFKNNPNTFSMTCLATANLPIFWLVHSSLLVSTCSRNDSFQFAEGILYSPKATSCEVCNFFLNFKLRGCGGLGKNFFFFLFLNFRNDYFDIFKIVQNCFVDLIFESDLKDVIHELCKVHYVGRSAFDP